MKKAGFRPNYGLYTLVVKSHAKSGKLKIAMSVFQDMDNAGFLPAPSSYACLLEMHAASGQVDPAMKLYNSMMNAGLRPSLSTYTALLTLLASNKLVDVAAKILLEMKAMGYPADVSASDVLMVYIKVHWISVRCLLETGRLFFSFFSLTLLRGRNTLLKSLLIQYPPLLYVCSNYGWLRFIG